jgi:hypothetical protein
LLTSTSTMAMAPAFAEGDDHDDDNKRYDKDDDNKRYDKDDDNKRYDKDGDGNKQKVEDESAGSIADCDDNEFERATQNCIATAATDDSVVVNGRDRDDDDDNGDDNGDGNGDGNGDPQTCEDCFDIFLGELSGAERTAVLAEIETGVSACDLELEELTDLLEEVLGEGDERVSDLEECIEDLVVIV